MKHKRLSETWLKRIKNQYLISKSLKINKRQTLNLKNTNLKSQTKIFKKNQILNFLKLFIEQCLMTLQSNLYSYSEQFLIRFLMILIKFSKRFEQTSWAKIFDQKLLNLSTLLKITWMSSTQQIVVFILMIQLKREILRLIRIEWG